MRKRGEFNSVHYSIRARLQPGSDQHAAEKSLDNG